MAHSGWSKLPGSGDQLLLPFITAASHRSTLGHFHLRGRHSVHISYVVSSVASPFHRFSHFISQWPYGVISQIANLSLNLRIKKKKSHPEDLGFVPKNSGFRQHSLTHQVSTLAPTSSVSCYLGISGSQLIGTHGIRISCKGGAASRSLKDLAWKDELNPFASHSLTFEIQEISQVAMGTMI